MIKFLFLILAFFSSLITKTFSQELITGSVIPEYGKIYKVSDPDLNTTDLKVFKVVFDIANAPENPAELNHNFERVARFINLHADNGAALKQIKPVLVVHGNAAMGLLKNEYYKEIFGTNNPNLDLLDKLHDLGVPVILCGQTAGARDITEPKRWRHTQVALSAMTALIYYQSKGYALINF